MKILWVVNKPCGALHEKLYGKKSTGGLWLDAMLDDAKESKEDSIVVVNIEKTPKISYYNDGNISYYTLVGEPNAKYDYKSKTAISIWKEIIDKEKPDVIELWGTEFPYGMAVNKVSEGIPKVIYVQGIIDSIGKYYLAGLTNKELKKAKSFRDVVTGTTIKQIQKDFSKRAVYEKEIVNSSGHIIIENHWAEAYYKKVCPQVKAHFLPISIAESFHNCSWKYEDAETVSIFCPAADYTIKGLHMLLKALAIVKQKYNNVKLYIPGSPLKETKTLKAKLKQNGYSRLIKSMLTEFDLNDNVVYTGRLTAEGMAEKMSKVNCFAMTSAIENHSSTLKEAMTVGVPCVASYVGGVPEYATHGENCLLYRFEDYEVLAQNIIRIFEDKKLCEKLSENARSKMRTPKEKTDYARMREIFEEIIKE